MTEQTEDAVYRAGIASNASPKAMLAAFETIIVESGAKNLASKAVFDSLSFPHEGVSNGDHDSVGAFQQRASWGSVKSRMNVGESAARFFHKAATHEKSNQTAGQLAQAVQVSAYPTRYDAAKDSATTKLAAAAQRNKGGKSVVEKAKDTILSPLEAAKNAVTDIPTAIQSFSTTLQKGFVSGYIIGLGIVLIVIGFFILTRSQVGSAAKLIANVAPTGKIAKGAKTIGKVL